MAYARVEETTVGWTRRGARFTRTQLGQQWVLDIGLEEPVTISQAALLLTGPDGRRVADDTVRWWVQMGQIVSGYYQNDPSLTVMIPLRAVRDAYARVHGVMPPFGDLVRTP